MVPITYDRAWKALQTLLDCTTFAQREPLLYGVQYSYLIASYEIVIQAQSFESISNTISYLFYGPYLRVGDLANVGHVVLKHHLDYINNQKPYIKCTFNYKVPIVFQVTSTESYFEELNKELVLEVPDE
jgi:hypothetical protein